jgi:hypothetical protein
MEVEPMALNLLSSCFCLWRARISGKHHHAQLYLFCILQFSAPCFFSPQCILKKKKKRIYASSWWLTPVILTTQEAEIRRTKVQS